MLGPSGSIVHNIDDVSIEDAFSAYNVGSTATWEES